MKQIRSLLPFIIAIGALVLSGCASQAPKPEWDGLVLTPHPRLAAVWVKPDAEIVAYRNVMIDPVAVSFSRNWDPNRGRSTMQRLSPADMQGIKDTVAEIFVDVFTAELRRGGYEVVTEPGPDTLRITAAIVDLYVTAPDMGQPGRTRTYVANSGHMVLVLEARDSVTGEILARAVDGRSGRSTGLLTFTNRATNIADARRAMNVWARALRDGLDILYQRAGAQPPSDPEA